MKKSLTNYIHIFLDNYSNLITFFLFLLILPLSAQDKKIAQTGFQFLTVGTNSRAVALGEAFTTVEAGSNSLFYNPAGMANSTSVFNFSVNTMNWIADIKYFSGSIGLSFADGKYGVVGITLQTVDYGDFLFTKVSTTSESGFEDITSGFSKPYALSIGLGYAIQLSDKFSVGGQVKFAKQSLGNSEVPIYEGINNITGTDNKQYSLGVFAFDFGTLYKTGFKSLAFGMSIRNFSQEVKFEKESFQLPLTFHIGLSIDAFDFIKSIKNNHNLNVMIDAVHPRSFPEYISIGVEYAFMKLLYLRGGIVTGQDLYDFSTGFGIKKYGIKLDYAYTPYSEFKDIHRFSIGFAL